MGNDVEELLRDGMRRATAGVAMEPDLAGRLATQAAGKRRRRRRRNRAGIAVTAAVAAAAGFLATGAVTSAGSATPRVQTVGYVLGHVDQALDGLAGRPMVAHVRSYRSLDGRVQAMGTAWLYDETATRHVALRQIFSSGGQLELAWRGVLQTEGRSTAWQVTGVSYPDRTWFTRTFWLPGVFPREPSCRAPDVLNLYVSGATLRQLVRCGDYVGVARQEVNGVPAIELVPARQRTRITPYTETVWVDAATFLPVRILIGGPLGGTSEVNVQWLPATPASLAHLTLTIPAGFRHAKTVP